MCLNPDTYDQLNVSGACDLTVHYITTALKCQSPSVRKSPQIPHKTPPSRINIPRLIDIPAQKTYSTHITQRSELMSVAYEQAQKQRYRITLDLSVFGDFDPHQIDWEKLFKLEPAEKCDAYVEDLSTPDRW